jgi:PAS domain S-box-containing protein
MSAAGKAVGFEASLGEILDCVAQPVWVVDRAGVIHFANPAALAALGYERLDELLGKPGHETIHYKHPDGSPFPVEECPMLRPRQTGETISVDEDWFIRSDGSMFPVAYTSAPLELGSGRGAVVAFTDIEERRAYEQALHDHDAILQMLAQPVLTTENGIIRYLNAAAVEVLGYEDASELVGRLGHWAVHWKRPDGSHYPIEQCPLWTASMKHQPVRDAEDMWVRRDGSMFPVSYSAVPLGLHLGVGMAVAFEDISERLAAERAKRERDVAEARAAEASAARRRVIEAADAERRRVTRDLHDGAQQELVNVITSLQLGREGWSQSEGVRKQLDAALEAANRGLRGLRELAAGMHPAILTTGGLGAAAEALAHRMPLPVELVELPSRRLPSEVEASVYFFLSEALTNVVKHAHASRATLRLAAEHDQLTVEVADDGVGGASFESGGSGLAGLADRIAAFEGRLEVRSEPGRGTTLYATVPLKAGCQLESEPVAAREK